MRVRRLCAQLQSERDAMRGLVDSSEAHLKASEAQFAAEVHAQREEIQRLSALLEANQGQARELERVLTLNAELDRELSELRAADELKNTREGESARALQSVREIASVQGLVWCLTRKERVSAAEVERPTAVHGICGTFVLCCFVGRLLLFGAGAERGRAYSGGCLVRPRSAGPQFAPRCFNARSESGSWDLVGCPCKSGPSGACMSTSWKGRCSGRHIERFVNGQDAVGRTPLKLLCEVDGPDPELCISVLAAGGDPTQHDEVGCTAVSGSREDRKCCPHEIVAAVLAWRGAG